MGFSGPLYRVLAAWRIRLFDSLFPRSYPRRLRFGNIASRGRPIRHQEQARLRNVLAPGSHQHRIAYPRNATTKATLATFPEVEPANPIQTSFCQVHLKLKTSASEFAPSYRTQRPLHRSGLKRTLLIFPSLAVWRRCELFPATSVVGLSVSSGPPGRNLGAPC